MPPDSLPQYETHSGLIQAPARTLRPAILFLIFLALLAALFLWNEYEDTRQRGEERAAAAAHVVAAHVEWLMEASRQSLQRMDEMLDAEPREFSAAAALNGLNEAFANMPERIAAAVYDAEGRRLRDTAADGDDNGSPFAPEAAQTPLFQSLRQGDKWHVTPIIPASEGSQPVFMVAKRLERHGRFAGAAVIAIPTCLMADFWKSLNLGPDAATSLIRSDGWVVARYPELNNSLNLGGHPLFMEHLAQQAAGTYEAISAADGQRRIVGYRTVARAPLVAVTAIAWEEAFKPFWTFFWHMLAIALPVSAAFLAVSLGMVWQGRQARKYAGETAVSLIRSQHALREIEERYRAIVEATPECVKVVAADGALLAMNPAGLGMIGAERFRNVEGTCVFDLIAPEHRDAFRSFHEKICAGESGNLQFDIIDLKGKRHSMETQAVPLRMSGSVTHQLAITRDVTARKDAEKKLQESERRFRSVFNLQFQFMAILSPEGSILNVNELPLQAAGLTREEVLGKPFWETPWWDGLPRMREAWPKRLAEAARSDGPILTVDEFRNARGELRLADAATTAVRNAEGGIEFYIIQATDITERKRAEIQLRDSEERFRQLADAMPQIVWTALPNGKVDYFNRRWYELTNAPPDSAMEYWPRVLHPGDRQRCMDLWKEAVRTGAPYQIEYRFKFQDSGDYRWFLGRALPARDQDGRIVRWFGTCTDIHDLKEAEARAEAASQAKSEFLANMSHEIRTPMNAVVGLANLLEKAAVSPERQQEFIRTLKQSAQQLMSLIDDLLDVGRIEAGRLELESTPFTLSDVLDDVMEAHAAPAEEKGLALRLENACDAKMGRLVGDPGRLRQILTNIVSNALKFTEQGGITLRAACKEQTADTAEIAIDVADTGIGIAPDMLEGIFSKFSQVDSSVTRKYSGTGLGLAISKLLAEEMGGAIFAESTYGKGSTFHITLPFALEKAEAAKGDETGEAEAASPSAGEKEAPVKILLVEDSAANVLVTTSFLDAFGYAYDVARNGREALEKCEREHFGVILMDVQMPEMDGYTATRILRTKETGKGMPRKHIIGMTAHALPEDREKCFEAGMDDYLSKPFRGAELSKRLARFAAGHGA